MRAAFEHWLVEHWYSTHVPPWYLRVLEPLYHAVYRRTRKNAAGKTSENKLVPPLIVVGNITAGGSGKTPLVIRLCQLALDMGLKPGIVTTGYGRKDRGTWIVEAHSDTATCGDEPVLLARRTGVPVVVAEERHEAIRKLAEMNLDLLISDDGLQQADLRGDMEFCVVDGERGLGNGHLLPAGPLREPPDRLAQVDFVISNGEWSSRPANLNTYLMNLQAGVVRSVDDTVEYPLEEFREKFTDNHLHAVAGIGHPKRFFRMLKIFGFAVQEHGFPDHHPFNKADFKSITPGCAIIMTEKDAVKCRSLGLQNAWYIPVEASLPSGLEMKFRERLSGLMKDR